jgi:hypothetical protein
MGESVLRSDKSRGRLRYCIVAATALNQSARTNPLLQHKTSRTAFDDFKLPMCSTAKMTIMLDLPGLGNFAKELPKKALRLTQKRGVDAPRPVAAGTRAG